MFLINGISCCAFVRWTTNKNRSLYAALFDRLSDGVATPRCCNHINIRWLGSD